MESVICCMSWCSIQTKSSHVVDMWQIRTRLKISKLIQHGIGGMKGEDPAIEKDCDRTFERKGSDVDSPISLCLRWKAKMGNYSPGTMYDSGSISRVRLCRAKGARGLVFTGPYWGLRFLNREAMAMEYTSKNSEPMGANMPRCWVSQYERIYMIFKWAT